VQLKCSCTIDEFYTVRRCKSIGAGSETPAARNLKYRGSNIFFSLVRWDYRVLRKIFGPRRDEVTGDWRKLHNEELHNLYSSPNIIRMIKSMRMRWTRHVARMVTKRNACRILVGKPEGKMPLRRTRSRWVDNIKIDLGEMGWYGLNPTGSG
jgi:hypothetical protein